MTLSTPKPLKREDSMDSLKSVTKMMIKRMSHMTIGAFYSMCPDQAPKDWFWKNRDGGTK